MAILAQAGAVMNGVLGLGTYFRIGVLNDFAIVNRPILSQYEPYDERINSTN
tara:strand:- start:42762 stop:42917 length:156 start_codon:yes stop_codon:yes gene_type:complete